MYYIVGVHYIRQQKQTRRMLYATYLGHGRSARPITSLACNSDEENDECEGRASEQHQRNPDAHAILLEAWSLRGEAAHVESCHLPVALPAAWASVSSSNRW